jgi:hypothetical protein
VRRGLNQYRIARRYEAFSEGRALGFPDGYVKAADEPTHLEVTAAQIYQVLRYHRDLAIADGCWLSGGGGGWRARQFYSTVFDVWSPARTKKLPPN